MLNRIFNLAKLFVLHKLSFDYSSSSNLINTFDDSFRHTYMSPIYHMKQPNYLVLWSKDKTFRSYRCSVAIYPSRNVQKNISKIWWVMLKKEIFLNKRIRCCKTWIAIFFVNQKLEHDLFLLLFVVTFLILASGSLFLLITSTIYCPNYLSLYSGCNS